MRDANKYGLEEIHRLLLNALDKFDRICRANGIRYSLHGGALLGAERNGKLIPWDDDIDVSMTRNEFNKFKNICEKTDGEFYLNEIVGWVSRFVNRDSSGTRVHIDILIWDYISEKKILQIIKINILRALQGTLKKDVDFRRYNLKDKILVGATNILGKPFSGKFKLKIFKYVGEHCFLGDRKYIHRSNDSFKGVSYIFDANYMNEYCDMLLEGKQYMVTSRYKEFLERSYGAGYLTPPPESERKPLHTELREMFLDDFC